MLAEGRLHQALPVGQDAPPERVRAECAVPYFFSDSCRTSVGSRYLIASIRASLLAFAAISRSSRRACSRAFSGLDKRASRCPRTGWDRNRDYVRRGTSSGFSGPTNEARVMASEPIAPADCHTRRRDSGILLVHGVGSAAGRASSRS